MTRVPAPTLDLLMMSAGFVVWGLAFAALYGLQGAGCAFGWDGVRWGPISALRAGLLALWALFLVANAAVIICAARRRRGEPALFRQGGFTLAIVAFVATFGTGAPAAILTMCH